MSMREDIEKSIIDNVNTTKLTRDDKIDLALNLFKDITESLEWLDFDEAEDELQLRTFCVRCNMELE